MGRPEKPIAAVAQLTGVSPDTIRAWERRYRLVRPLRDAAGVRRYSEGDVRRISLAQRATRYGHPIGRIAKLSDSEIERLLDEHQPPEDASAPAAAAAEHVVNSAYQAVERYDVSAAASLLQRAAVLMEPSDFILTVLAPLLRRVGDGWASGNVGVPQEHIVSALVRDLISAFLRIRSGSRPTVLFATPPEELHDLGLGLAACMLAMRGAKAIFLGGQVPAPELILAATRLDARAVVVSSLVELAEGAWESYVRVLDAHLPLRTALWVGGSGADRLGNVLGARINRFATLEAFSEFIDAQHSIWLR